MRTRAKDSSNSVSVGGAKLLQGRRCSGIMLALHALAACGLLQACAETRRNGDVASGGRPDMGSAGRSGAGSPAAGVADGGSANEPIGGGGGAGADNSSIHEGLAGAAGESGGGLAPGAAAPSYFQAGTRLKPRVMRGGGLEVLDVTADSTWYDTQTGESCLFRTGADGVERCFPSAGQNDLTVYLDAACTKPAFVGPSVGCEGRPFNYISYGPYNGTSCSSPIYRIGAPLAQSVELFSNAADSCISMGESDQARPLEEVPPEAFVAVERVSRTHLPNMNAWVREGADGSWEVTAFHDPIRNAACSGLGLASTTDACIPSWVEPTHQYADAACTVRVSYDERNKCGSAAEPVALMEPDVTNDACGSVPTFNGLWEIAAEPPTELFAFGLDGCDALSVSVGSAKAYLQGAPIDVTSLPQLETIQVGTGSLRLSYYGFAGVPFFPIPGAPFLEAASGDTCRPYAFADGATRCVPSTFEVVSNYNHYYKTADCSGDLVYPWFDACNDPAPVGVIIQPFGCAKRVTETLEFDGTVPTAGGLFHPTPSSSCQDSGFVAREGAKWFRATKPVNPADRFITFERSLGD